jgi:hypothetical protein
MERKREGDDRERDREGGEEERGVYFNVSL